jgi:phosphoribosyl-AMP cyclohydrolase
MEKESKSRPREVESAAKAEEFVLSVDFKKGDGLVPVITQDVHSKDVLMLAYANKEALKLSFTTGVAHYWSRSRASLWKKGETSGHVQNIRSIKKDCDSDTLLYLVDQVGPACHRGTRTCFDDDDEKTA